MFCFNFWFPILGTAHRGTRFSSNVTFGSGLKNIDGCMDGSGWGNSEFGCSNSGNNVSVITNSLNETPYGMNGDGPSHILELD